MAAGKLDRFYWRERDREVDFVLRAGRMLIAIEVKSGRTQSVQCGMQAIIAAFKPGGFCDVIAVDDFFAYAG